MTRYAAPFTPEPAPTLTCTDCHAVPIQVAPGRWDIEVFASQSHPSATVSWGFVSESPKLYDPSVRGEPGRAIGSTSALTLVLQPNHPMIVAIQH